MAKYKKPVGKTESDFDSKVTHGAGYAVGGVFYAPIHGMAVMRRRKNRREEQRRQHEELMNALRKSDGPAPQAADRKPLTPNELRELAERMERMEELRESD